MIQQTLSDTLGEHPSIGISGGVGGGVIGWLELFWPILSTLAALVGVAVGCVTIWAKIRQDKRGKEQHENVIESQTK